VHTAFALDLLLGLGTKLKKFQNLCGIGIFAVDRKSLIGSSKIILNSTWLILIGYYMTNDI